MEHRHRQLNSDSIQIWESHFNTSYVDVGAYVRGHDTSGKQCAGVVWYAVPGCRHLEVKPLDGSTSVHIHAFDVAVLRDEQLTAEELAFALEQRDQITSLGDLYELTAGFRGCPHGHELLMRALREASQDL